jgi:hypothetical protein
VPLLNEADRIYLGKNPVDSMWLDGLMVWPSVLPFSPLEIPTLLMWMDATVLTGKSDGDTVPYWPDTSGNAFGATIYAGNVVYSADGINGKPALRFGAYGTFAEMRIDHGRTIGSRTIFQVVKNIGQYGSFATTQLQITDPYMQTYSTGGTVHTYTTPDLNSGAPWSGEGQLVTVWGDTATSTQGLKVDSTEVTSAWAPNASTGHFQLGANAAASYGMNGWIGEILIYDRCLTVLEREDVQTYLREKWSLT